MSPTSQNHPRVEAIEGCRSCGSTDLHTFLDLGAMPLSDGLKDAREIDTDDERFPLEVAFCSACTLVQIRHTVAPEVLFADDYPYYSSFSDALIAHSKKNVDSRIDELRLGPGDLAVELASNDGYLLQHYVARGVKVQGIDPAKGPVEAARKKGIPTHHEFFTEAFAEQLASEGVRADVIHGNNVLAHVADTNGFVRGLKVLLAPDGVAVIEVPYLRDLIEHTEFDTIYHEHLCYFSAHALVELFKRSGLYLNRVERLSIHGGSLRLFVGHDDDPETSITRLLAEENALGMTGLDYYRSFTGQVEAVRDGLREIILRLKRQGMRIAGYGAAAKGAIMLEYAGLGTDELAWVADRNVHKQGRHMPGNHLLIVSPDRILEERPDYLLILPWNFKDEIMSQQSEFAAGGGQFIVPVPTPEILTPGVIAKKEAS
ncbi:MAG: SAM-dependent methyltransferase [Planctomycetota bacterium]|jgi:SAM-dependent methyltransferase